jgi:hypothetical protein
MAMKRKKEMFKVSKKKKGGFKLSPKPAKKEAQ